MYKKLLIIFLILITLTGCSNIKQSNTTPSSEEQMITTEEITETSTEEVEVPQEIKYWDTNILIPVKYDNNIVGGLTVNFIEKLGIWDFNNAKAVSSSIKKSYVLNLKLDMSNFMNGRSTETIICTPYLLDGNDNIIGESCTVGWSGFNHKAEFFSNDSTKYIEVGLQPYVNDIKDSYKLKLELQTLSGNIKFQDIYLDINVLKQAKAGAKLLSNKDTTVITSANGAQYSIKINAVYREGHNYDDIYSEDSLEDFYDIVYTIKYLKGPTNKREVAIFDTYNKNALSEPMKFSLYTDTDSTRLYKPENNVYRLKYSDSTDTELYVTRFSNPLFVGEKTTLTTNRKIPASTLTDCKYVRLAFEFPEEASVRSYNSLKSFKGRYVVYQLPVKSRKLQKEPER